MKRRRQPTAPALVAAVALMIAASVARARNDDSWTRVGNWCWAGAPKGGNTPLFFAVTNRKNRIVLGGTAATPGTGQLECASIPFCVLNSPDLVKIGTAESQTIFLEIAVSATVAATQGRGLGPELPGNSLHGSANTVISGNGYGRL